MPLKGVSEATRVAAARKANKARLWLSKSDLINQAIQFNAATVSLLAELNQPPTPPPPQPPTPEQLENPEYHKQNGNDSNGMRNPVSPSPHLMLGNQPLTLKERATLLVSIMNSWDKSLERLRLLRGQPAPGSFRPGPGVPPKAAKPKNRPPDDAPACGIQATTGSVQPAGEDEQKAQGTSDQAGVDKTI